MLIPALIGFVSAFALSFVLSPLVYWLASRVGLMDDPDGNRKRQQKPVALGGGFVVYVSLVTVVMAMIAAGAYWGAAEQPSWRDVLGFGLSSTIIVAVGLVDDRFGLRGRHKLMGQIAAAGCLMSAGLVVQHISVFGISIELGLLSIPFTLFWLLGATNAVNLLDGIDGLATSLGIILTGTICGLAVMHDHRGVAVLALLLTGSLLGFLRYNWPPARMYLGDAGSMLIGLLVGGMAIRASLKGTGTVLLAAPLALWAIPIMDSAAALLRRKLTGRSMFTPDRGHLHHRLLQVFGSNLHVVMVVSLCCVVTSGGALASVFNKSDTYSVVACAGVLAMLLVTGLFGRAELSLLFSYLRQAGGSLLSLQSGQDAARESTVRLQGSQKWEVLWETLTEAADKLDLYSVHLDVNAPALHESYVAKWKRSNKREPIEQMWRVELPLSVNDIEVGRLLVLGRRNAGSGLVEIIQLLDLLEPFEQCLLTFATPSVQQDTPQPVVVQSSD